MIEIAKRMGWKYVSTVAAEGEYGEKGIASFVALAKTQGICIAVSTKGRWMEWTKGTTVVLELVLRLDTNAIAAIRRW